MTTDLYKALRTRLTVAACCTLAASGLVLSSPALANDLIVTYDQSQLLRLPRPAAEIIIGNPMIADVAVQSGDMLVVTGKTFGITNIIALDNQRNVIQDQRVIVQRNEINIVHLHKAGKRESYNCAPQCNPTMTVGDDPAFFGATAGTSQQKISISSGQVPGAGRAN